MGGNVQKGKNVEGDMIQNSVVIKHTTYDELMKLLSAGNSNDAMKLLKMQENVIGTVHPYYPHYSLGIKRIGDDLVPYSKPLSQKAIEKCPPKITGKLSIDPKYKGFKDINELLDYSYKTQTEIEINEVELMKMLGDDIDPYQEELELLLSKTKDWRLKPKEFPEAKPYKIAIKGSDVSYDYILLRATRIEDNKAYLSNNEQVIDTEFNFIIDLKNKNMIVNVKFNQDTKTTKKSLLKYLRFMKSTIDKSKFSIIALEYDEILAEGIIDNFNYNSSFGNIENEIAFVEYITLIEEHYNTIIEIPEQINKDELEAVYYLGEALKSGEIKGTWQEGTYDFIIGEDFKENIKDLEDSSFSLSHATDAKVLIFNREFYIPKITSTYNYAQIKDLDKIKKKAAVLDNGDIIKITFLAKEDNRYSEQFYFQKEEQ